jgi:type I restriction enzyme, S subunit
VSDLPNGWIDAPFGHLFDFKGGSQPSKATFSDHQRPGYVRLLQIRDFESDAKAVFIKDHPRWPKCSVEDIMIGRYGASVGKILRGKSGAYNVALVKMIFEREFFDPSWVRLFLLSDYFQEPLKRISRSAQNGFNKADLEEIEVPLPPLPEQRRIVAKINSLSAKSRRARDQLDHIPRLVEKYKQAILAAAFTGELTRGWRKRQGKELPSWISQAWENAGETLNGRAFPSADYSTTGVKLLRPGNLHASGRVEWTAQNTRFLPVKYSNDFPRYLFKGSELVINLTAQSLEDAFLGRACLSSKDDEFLLNQRIALFRPFEMDKKYCLYVLKSPLFREFVDNGLHAGSLIRHVHTKQLMKFVFPIAPPQEQNKIVSRIEIAFAWIERLVAEATSARKLIDHLDQAILATAFLGELVRQNPNDEPAGVLLERIRAERQAASTPRSRGKKQKADA